jgi:hypothetical protein
MLLLIREICKGFQLPDQPVGMMRVVHKHPLLLCRRECIELSAIRACDCMADASAKIRLY